jgi:hypothetical protein
MRIAPVKPLIIENLAPISLTRMFDGKIKPLIFELKPTLPEIITL